MRRGQSLGRVEREREEDDEALVGVEEADGARRTPVGSRTRRSISAGSSSASRPAAGSASGSRWLCTSTISGTPVDDRPLDLLRDPVRLVERELAGQLEVERDVEAVGQLDHREVVDLPDARDRHGGLAHPLAQGRLHPRGLDVDDDVAPRERFVDGCLDTVGDGMALADGGSGRDADHDVGERAPGGLAEAEASHLDAAGRAPRSRPAPRAPHPPAPGP